MIEEMFRNLKKDMIGMSRDFCCPVTGKILDMDRDSLIRITRQDKKTSDFMVHKDAVKLLNGKALKTGCKIEVLTAETCFA